MNINKKIEGENVSNTLLIAPFNKYYQWTVDRLFESKKFMKICSKTHQIARFPKKFSGEACPQTPLANAWLRNASQASSPKKKLPPPLANPAYAYELLLRNLFENPSWQTVDCV